MRDGDDGADHLAPPQGIIYERLTAPRVGFAGKSRTNTRLHQQQQQQQL
jgi:hypothetical protein